MPNGLKTWSIVPICIYVPILYVFEGIGGHLASSDIMSTSVYFYETKKHPKQGRGDSSVPTVSSSSSNVPVPASVPCNWQEHSIYILIRFSLGVHRNGSSMSCCIGVVWKSCESSFLENFHCVDPLESARMPEWYSEIYFDQWDSMRATRFTTFHNNSPGAGPFNLLENKAW